MQLNLTSRDLYEQLAQEFGNFELKSRGLLMLCKSRATFDSEKRLAADATRLGLNVSVLDPGELAELDSRIEMDVVGGVHFLDDRHLDPALFMRRLRESLVARGVQIVSGKAIRLTHDNSSISAIVFEAGSVSADEFVLAAGSWTAALGDTLGLRMPMQAGKGYSFDVASPIQMPTIPAILVEGRVAVTPLPDRLRFSGTLEITGNDLSINLKRIQGIKETISRYYPRFLDQTYDASPVWAGLRPCSPDGMPYVGRTKRFDNLCIATGHSMMGLSLGPVTGKLIAATLAREPHGVATELLLPDRFG